MDILAFADQLQSYLVNNGIRFNEHGFLIFEDGMLLTSEPEEVLPYKARHQAVNAKSTLIGFFEFDKLLYRRFKTLEEDAKELTSYLGIGGFDLSPNIHWDLALQRFNILFSQMYTAYMVLHGIKVVPNFRTGNLETLDALNSYPSDSMFIAGTLGTHKNDTSFGSTLLKSKLIIARPSKILVYGHIQHVYREILSQFGVPYIQFDDYHTACNQRRCHYGC